jgi:hypothetical protein
MTQDKRPGLTATQLALVLIVAGLIGEMSPGFSHDFPGGGWSLMTAGAAALAAGILQKRSPRLARLVLILGFLAAGAVLLRGCADSSRARGSSLSARTS